MKKLFLKWLKNLRQWYVEGLTGELQIDQRKLRKVLRKNQKRLEAVLKSQKIGKRTKTAKKTSLCCDHTLCCPGNTYRPEMDNIFK